jgi:hypothetical protein
MAIIAGVGIGQRLYPNLKLTLATADALLILDYARRTAPTAGASTA